MRKSMERDGEGGAWTKGWGSGMDGKEKSVRVCVCVSEKERKRSERLHLGEKLFARPLSTSPETPVVI